jgi:hypothetical protein
MSSYKKYKCDQDQSIVALKSGYIDTIWKGVAEVKKYGYKIDDITSYPITSSVTRGDTTANIPVVISKQKSIILGMSK